MRLLRAIILDTELKSENREAKRVLIQTRKKLEGVVGAAVLGVAGHVSHLIQAGGARITWANA